MFDPAGTLTGGATERGAGVLAQISALKAAREELVEVEKGLETVDRRLAEVCMSGEVRELEAIPEAHLLRLIVLLFYLPHYQYLH